MVSSARRIIALWFARLPTDRLRRRWLRRPPPDAALPLVLVAKVENAMRLTAVDAKAAVLGLTAGMALASARAMVPALKVMAANEPADLRLLEKIATYKDLLPFVEIVPIGAKMGLNLDPLWTILERDATQPGWLHEEEVFTDQTERSLAAEFIREKVLRKTREEVPHGVAVLIEQWLEPNHDDYPEDLGPEGVFIAARILVDRDGHRKILLGSGGEMIKDIRQSAQRELRKLLQRPVRLELFVKVDEGWRDRPERLDRLSL